MNSTDASARRFAVALSFPGEHRRFVRNVAERLAEEFGKQRVFFDEWYEHEIRGVDADLKLKRVYRNDADLVVPFFSEHYPKMWCQIEWHAIRVVLAERRKGDAVLPVHLDGTRIEGWESVDLGVRRGRKTGRQIADAIIRVYQQRRQWKDPSAVAGQMVSYELIHGTQQPPPWRPLQRALENAYADGELRYSLLAPIVVSTLSKAQSLELAHDMSPDWAIRGVRLSDEYFVRVSASAGHRDWQRDFAQCAAPLSIGLARSLRRSADAHAFIVQLCNAVAARLRVALVWPEDADSYNHLTNDIYRACLRATHLEDDDVLVAFKGLTVVGPH